MPNRVLYHAGQPPGLGCVPHLRVQRHGVVLHAGAAPEVAQHDHPYALPGARHSRHARLCPPLGPHHGLPLSPAGRRTTPLVAREAGQPAALGMVEAAGKLPQELRVPSCLPGFRALGCSTSFLHVPWSLFMSLLTHRLVILCVDAYCFIFWDLPGHCPGST